MNKLLLVIALVLSACSLDSATSPVYDTGYNNSNPIDEPYYSIIPSSNSVSNVKKNVIKSSSSSPKPTDNGKTIITDTYIENNYGTVNINHSTAAVDTVRTVVYDTVRTTTYDTVSTTVIQTDTVYNTVEVMEYMENATLPEGTYNSVVQIGDIEFALMSGYILVHDISRRGASYDDMDIIVAYTVNNRNMTAKTHVSSSYYKIEIYPWYTSSYDCIDITDVRLVSRYDNIESEHLTGKTTLCK